MTSTLAAARTLLLVDDDPAILRGLKWSFEDCEVHTASDRESALRQVKALRPPVVTLDLGLPPHPTMPWRGCAPWRRSWPSRPRPR